MSLAVNTLFNLNATLTKVLDLSTPEDALSFGVRETWGDATGDDHTALEIYHGSPTIADGASTTIDLTALTNSLGVACACFDKLKILMLRLVDNGEGSGLILGNAAANAVDIFGADVHTALIPPGGVFIMTWPDGLDVTTETDLMLTHDGVGTAAIEVEIIVVGDET